MKHISRAARGIPLLAIWMTYSTIESFFVVIPFILVLFLLSSWLPVKQQNTIGRIISLDYIISRKHTFIKIVRVGSLFAILVLLLSWYISLKALFLASTELGLNASFNQQLNAIIPYIDAAEEKRLKSAWALMRNRSDYVKINSQIAKHAEDARIDLPKSPYE